MEYNHKCIDKKKSTKGRRAYTFFFKKKKGGETRHMTGHTEREKRVDGCACMCVCSRHGEERVCVRFWWIHVAVVLFPSFSPSPSPSPSPGDLD